MKYTDDFDEFWYSKLISFMMEASETDLYTLVQR